MTDTGGTVLQSISEQVAGLERELERLRALLGDTEEQRIKREREIARAMYRRGYSSGYQAMRRGEPQRTAPEHQARTELRTMLRAAA